MTFKDCDKLIKCKKYNEGLCPIKNPNVDPFCIKWFKIDTLQNESLLEDRQKKDIPLVLDDDGADRDAYMRLKQIQSQVESFVEQGGNIFIWSSNTGNGKSTFACKIINSFIDKIWYKSDLKCRCLFINVPKLLISLRDNITQKSDYVSHIKENVLTADIVVWDDIGTKGFTTFEMENLFNFIDSRLSAGKANIYTSNLMGEYLQEAIGDRLYSRVVNTSEIIQFVGKDKRGIKVR